ncbi:MAG: hypothetical protein M3Q10_20215 [Chloroflexota bacterium]|nr:hypothetical protein [Chloroflexota bacterium]
MMRWTPTDVDGVREETDSARTGAAPRATNPVGDGTFVRYLLDAVAATVVGIGARSAVLLVVMAVIVAALLFGLSAGEAAAGVQWCRTC